MILQVIAIIVTLAMTVPGIPGAVNPQVTQANIQQTICRPGYTKTIRPPVTYTDPLKVQLMRTHHLSGKSTDYELDHLIPLELGGHPRSLQNLWMQVLSEARIKDRLENILNKAVCGKKLTLTDAQDCIRKNWVNCAHRMGVQ